MERRELYRKLIHLSGVVVPLSYSLTPEGREHTFVISLTILTLVSLAVDLLRLKLNPVRKFVERVFGPAMREREKSSITTFSIFLLGSFLTVLLFDRKVTIASLLILSLADPAAAIFGMKFGRVRLWKNKTLEGTASFFIASFIIAFSVFGSWKVVVPAIISSATELITPGTLDNLTIPLVAALSLHAFCV